MSAHRGGTEGKQQKGRKGGTSATQRRLLNNPRCRRLLLPAVRPPARPSVWPVAGVELNADAENRKEGRGTAGRGRGRGGGGDGETAASAAAERKDGWDGRMGADDEGSLNQCEAGRSSEGRPDVKRVTGYAGAVYTYVRFAAHEVHSHSGDASSTGPLH